MKLLKILESVSGSAMPASWQNLDIQNIVFQSQDVRPNSIFVAIRGSQKDGHEFLADAIQATLDNNEIIIKRTEAVGCFIRK